MSFSNPLFVSPGQFLAHLADDDAAFTAEIERINALGEDAIPKADLLGFANVLVAYKTFTTAARAKAESANVLVAPVMTDEDAQLIVFERQLREWQDHAASLGFPAVTPMVPRDAPDHPGNEPGHGFDLPSFGDALSISTGTKVALTVLGLGILVLAVRR